MEAQAFPPLSLGSLPVNPPTSPPPSEDKQLAGLRRHGIVDAPAWNLKRCTIYARRAVD